MNDDAIEEAVRLLTKRRDEALAEAQRINEALAKLGGGSAPPAPAGLPVTHGRSASVRTMLVTLLDEEDKDWSAAEVLLEYRRRGTPIHGNDPSNALRAAIADANKRGLIFRTDVGRYKSARFTPGQAGDEWRGQEVLR